MSSLRCAQRALVPVGSKRALSGRCADECSEVGARFGILCQLTPIDQEVLGRASAIGAAARLQLSLRSDTDSEIPVEILPPLRYV